MRYHTIAKIASTLQCGEESKERIRNASLRDAAPIAMRVLNKVVEHKSATQVKYNSSNKEGLIKIYSFISSELSGK
jgi:hypothetical protein